MMQDFINKHFFNLYIFTLIFGHIFYGTIGFDYTDEICALFLVFLYGYNLFKNPSWDINKVFLGVICIFIFYLCYSYGSKVMSMRQSYQISLYNSSLIWPSSAYIPYYPFSPKIARKYYVGSLFPAGVSN